MDIRREDQKELAVRSAEKAAAGRLHLRISLTGFAFMAGLSLLENCSMTIGLGGRLFNFGFFPGYILCHPMAMIAGLYLAGMLLLGLIERRGAKRLRASPLAHHGEQT